MPRCCRPVLVDAHHARGRRDRRKAFGDSRRGICRRAANSSSCAEWAPIQKAGPRGAFEAGGEDIDIALEIHPPTPGNLAKKFIPAGENGLTKIRNGVEGRFSGRGSLPRAEGSTGRGAPPPQEKGSSQELSWNLLLS